MIPSEAELEVEQLSDSAKSQKAKNIPQSIEAVPTANFQSAIQSEAQPIPDASSSPHARSSSPVRQSGSPENPIYGLVQKNIEAISPTKSERELEIEFANETAEVEQPIDTPARQETNGRPSIESQPEIRLSSVLGGEKDDLDNIDDLIGADKFNQSSDLAIPNYPSPSDCVDGFVTALDILEECESDAACPVYQDTEMMEDNRSSIKVADANCNLVNIDKIRIFIHFEGTTTVVSWPRDTDGEEVQRAVLCACDCIYSGGSAQLLELNPVTDEAYLRRLLDSRQDEVGGSLVSIQEKNLVEDSTKAPPIRWYQRGQLLPFESFKEGLRNNTLYLLQPTVERLELASITGDEYRRLLISVPALSHIEAGVAIKVLRQGANLIKTTRLNEKHFRFFQLSTDLKRLLWYSGRKLAEDTTLNMSDIAEIKITKFANATDTSLQNHQSPDDQFFQRCSFTIVAKKGSLQLCAKSEDEFDTWVTGLKALAAHFHDVPINKVQLLGHSRKFRKELEAASKRSISQEADKDIVALPPVNENQSRLLTKDEALQRSHDLAAALGRLTSKLKALDQSKNLTTPEHLDASAESQPDMTDVELEHWQAWRFINESETALKALSSDIRHATELTFGDQCSLSTPEPKELMISVTRRLWEINVNIENINDMILRLSEDNDPLNLAATLTTLQKHLDVGKERFVQSWTHFTEQIVKPTVQRLKSQDSANKMDLTEPPSPT